MSRACAFSRTATGCVTGRCSLTSGSGCRSPRWTKLIREKHDKIIDDFHKTVHTEEVDRQMQGIHPSPADLNPSTIEYELKERATVARLLFQPLDDLKLDQMFRVRIQLVQALVDLCKRQETAHQFKKSTKVPRAVKAADTSMSMDQPTPSTSRLPVDAVVHAAGLNHGPDGPLDEPVTPGLYCPFCKWGDEEVGPRKRDHVYARPDSLGRHIRDQHLAERDPNDGFDYEGYFAFLGGGMYFLNHAARQHKLTLWCATKR